MKVASKLPPHDTLMLFIVRDMRSINSIIRRYVSKAIKSSPNMLNIGEGRLGGSFLGVFRHTPPRGVAPGAAWFLVLFSLD